MASAVVFKSFVPIDGNRVSNGQSGISVPATGAAATVTITDPADGSDRYITILEILAAYSGAGSGTMTIAQGTGPNQYGAPLGVTANAEVTLAQQQAYFPIGSGNVVVTLPGSGSTQGILLVVYDIQ